MNRKFIVAILLAAALPAFAQTQNPSAAKITKADDQVGLDVDQGQKIRSHQRRHGLKTARSERLAAFNYLLSDDATTRSLSRSNSRQSQHQIQRRMTDYLAPFSSLTMRPAPCHCALKSAIASSRALKGFAASSI